MRRGSNLRLHAMHSRLPQGRTPLTARLVWRLCAALLGGCAEADAKPAPPPEAPVEVAVVEVLSEPVALTSELAGRTNAFVTAEVRPQVTGIIKSRDFREGASVTAGQLLYESGGAHILAETVQLLIRVGRIQGIGGQPFFGNLFDGRGVLELHRVTVAVRAVLQGLRAFVKPFLQMNLQGTNRPLG